MICITRHCFNDIRRAPFWGVLLPSLKKKGFGAPISPSLIIGSGLALRSKNDCDNDCWSLMLLICPPTAPFKSNHQNYFLTFQKSVKERKILLMTGILYPL